MARCIKSAARIGGKPGKIVARHDGQEELEIGVNGQEIAALAARPVEGGIEHMGPQACLHGNAGGLEQHGAAARPRIVG